MKYTLRVQFGLHQDPHKIGERWSRLCVAADVDEVMLFFFAEEYNNGHETLEEIDKWIAHSEPIIRALRKVGVRVSLNPWHSLLHVDRGRRLKPNQSHWQRMMDPEGRLADAVLCPLDPGWRSYYAETLDRYAGMDVDAVWIDDDIRLHNHGDLHWGGCFCPLHVNAFSERVGQELSREEIVAACTAPGAPHSWRALWMELWDEQQTALIQEWRECVEKKGKRLGLMTSLPEQHAAEGRNWRRWWKAMGEEAVLHRPHFWPYADISGSQMPTAIYTLDQNRFFQPESVVSCPEIECVPYSPWNKSYSQTAAQMVLAQVFGASSLQLSLYDHMGNDPDDDPSREELLTNWKSTLKKVEELFPANLRSQGISVPWTEEMGRRVPTVNGGDWQELVCANRGWVQWLGAAGLATTVHRNGSVKALSGPGISCFTDDEIGEWLKEGVLLDGRAASILVERGWGPWIGASGGRMLTQEQVPYSVEACIHPGFNSRTDALISVNSEFFTPYGQILWQGELMETAFEITELRGPLQQRVGHGLVGFENEWGGRVVIAPWSAESPVHMNNPRLDQLGKVVSYLNRGQSGVQVKGGAWVVPLLMQGEGRWGFAIWNAGGDAVKTLKLSGLPEVFCLEEAFMIQNDSTCLDVQWRDGQPGLPCPLQPWECILLSGR